MNPADTDAVAFFECRDVLPELIYVPHDFVTEYHWKARRRRVAFDLIELGMTDAADGNAYSHLALPGFGYWEFNQL